MSDLRQRTLAYLAGHQVMTLAVTADSSVWAAAVFYVNSDFSLYFLSAGHTRHARYIQRNAWLAATIQEDYVSWQAIKGIQMEGPVTLLEGIERTKTIDRYVNKYPFVAAEDSEMGPMLQKVNWYCFKPSLLYFIDNSKGLGHRDEVPL